MKPIFEVISMLPPAFASALLACGDETLSEICEVRMRKNLPFCACAYSESFFIGEKGKVTEPGDAVFSCREDILATVRAISSGSIYRYSDELTRGFIVTDSGLRAGICGEGFYDGARFSSLCEYTSVNIRIPRNVRGSAAPILRFFNENGLCSTLIYSPPAVGKTTMIRDLCLSLSRGEAAVCPKKVAVIDERREIFPDSAGLDGGMLDIFSGYKKSDGLEIATRLFSPDVIVCDEIGGSDDAEAILSVEECGVPLIATTHGESIDSLRARPVIRRLLEAGIFKMLVCLEKNGVSPPPPLVSISAYQAQ